MVSINKNIENVDKSLLITSSKISSKNLDNIFAELFSLVDMTSIDEKNKTLNNTNSIIFSIKNSDFFKNNLKEIGKGEQLSEQDKISSNLLSDTNSVKTNNFINKSDAEINAAKSLISVFYTSLKNTNELSTKDTEESSENNQKNYANENILNKINLNIKKKGNLSEKIQKETFIKKESLNTEENHEQILTKEKKSNDIVNNSMQAISVKSKIKKKIDQQKIKVDLILNEEENQNQTKSSLIIQHRVSFSPKLNNKNIEIEQKFIEEKNTNSKNDIKKTPQLNNGLSEKSVLDLMESSWGEKFVKIIKSNISKGINKIDLNLEPNNLGKLKIEIAVDGEKTDIKINTENKLASNILNENYQKLNDMLERESLKLNTFSSMSNGQNNSDKKSNQHNQNSGDSLKNKIDSRNIELSEKIEKKTIHSVDINA